jgi:hypothetical protein
MTDGKAHGTKQKENKVKNLINFIVETILRQQPNLPFGLV